MPIKYKAKYSGNVYNTRSEAISDNANWMSDPLNRFDYKSKSYPKYEEIIIPFIKSKRRTLSNAGLATGAVISENLLDSIAKYAEIEGIPIKTALGLAVKESTLGNPTDNKDVFKLSGEDATYARTKQYINRGVDINGRQLINYFKDTWNPYEEAIKIAKRKAGIYNNYFGKPYIPQRGVNDPKYKEDLEIYNKRKHIVDSILVSGEKYADRLATKRKSSIKGNVLQAGFRDYKNNPRNYNPGQSNYSQLVDKRANEVWGSPEIQNWYKDYSKRRTLESRGKLTK